MSYRNYGGVRIQMKYEVKWKTPNENGELMEIKSFALDDKGVQTILDSLDINVSATITEIKENESF